MTTMASLCGSLVGIVIIALFAPPVCRDRAHIERPTISRSSLGMTGAVASARLNRSGRSS